MNQNIINLSFLLTLTATLSACANDPVFDGQAETPADMVVEANSQRVFTHDAKSPFKADKLTTVEPTPTPDGNPFPTEIPTVAPTTMPTTEPTVEPTTMPTSVPTTEPTTEPTAKPTAEPTVAPTAEPTTMPTPSPSAILDQGVAYACSTMHTQSLGQNLKTATEGVEIALGQVESVNDSRSALRKTANTSNQHSPLESFKANYPQGRVNVKLGKVFKLNLAPKKAREDLLNLKMFRIDQSVQPMDDGVYIVKMVPAGKPFPTDFKEGQNLAFGLSILDIGRDRTLLGSGYMAIENGQVVDFTQLSAPKSATRRMETKWVGKGTIAVLYDKNSQFMVAGSTGTKKGPQGRSDGETESSQDECDVRYSPLALDIGEPGFNFSAPLDGMLFDINADGKKDQISCPINVDAEGNEKPDVGLLALPNRRGEVSSGRELFGDATFGPHDRETSANGFDALKKYDENSDGHIDNADSVYSKLKLWVEVDCDGIASSKELHSLEALHIARIQVGYKNKLYTDKFGNWAREMSFFEYFSKDSAEVWDIWFRSVN